MKVNLSVILLKQTTKEEREQLIRDFYAYKKGVDLPSSIGRDAPYDRPPSAVSQDLSHIHMGNWEVHEDQYWRTSNTILVYCQHVQTRDRFCLISLLRPDAHDIQNDLLYMARLADEAERFHNAF